MDIIHRWCEIRNLGIIRVQSIVSFSHQRARVEVRLGPTGIRIRKINVNPEFDECSVAPPKISNKSTCI